MTSDAPSDQSLLVEPRDERSIAVSHTTLHELFAMQAPYVWNTLRRLGVPPPDLEDVTHDVFMQVQRHLDEYDATRPIKPWLFGFAFRLASQHRRRAFRRYETQTHEWEQAADPTVPPDEQLSNEQNRRLVLEALETIPIERRGVFVLSQIDGVPMSEVAASMGIPVNTAHSRLRLARDEFAAAVKRLPGSAGGSMSQDAFDPDLDALLDAERQAKAPERALARVGSRLALSLAGTMGAPGASTKVLRQHGWLASHTGAVAAFVAGGIVGASVYAVVQRPAPPRVVYVDRPALPAPSTLRGAPDPWAPEAPPRSPAQALPSPRPSAASAPAESLAVERRVLDQARTALTSGDAASVLALIDDHAKRFHKPQLAEEREALAVQSLVVLGRYDEARARGTKLKEASPNSLFVPVIDSALGSIP